MKKFVDAQAKVSFGKEAEKLLAEANDFQFFEETGIVRVDSDRWKIAQEYESSGWMKRARGAKDDHNRVNIRRLGGLSCLDDNKINSIMEVGCGPFTNIRLLLPKHLEIKRVVLNDPLIKTYLKHPNCTYKQLKLCGRPVEVISESFEKIGNIAPVDCLVLINVLEHCYDASTIFKNICKLLNPGGFLIFSDLVFDVSVVKSMAQSWYNAGHPLRLSEAFVRSFLSKFTPVYEKEVPAIPPLKAKILSFVGRIGSSEKPGAAL